MQIGYIEGATRVIGESQGYSALPICDYEIDHSFAEGAVERVPAMASAWVPEPHELEALNNGAAIILQVLGTAHPRVMLGVGEPPKDDIPLVADQD